MINRVQTPREGFSPQRAGYLTSPVIVSTIASVKSIIKWLHESVKLWPKSGFKRFHVSFTFSPFGAAIFEPDLKKTK